MCHLNFMTLLMAVSPSSLAKVTHLGLKNIQATKKEEAYQCPHGLPESC